MEAKEKAKELVLEMVNSSEPFKHRTEHSKKCALIAVDEIISLMIKFHGRHIENNTYEIIYWEEVKQEIEKI